MVHAKLCQGALQVRGAKRFLQKVIHAGRLAACGFLGHAFRSDCDDVGPAWPRALSGSNAGGGLDSAHDWHLNVHENDIGLGRGGSESIDDDRHLNVVFSDLTKRPR